MRKTRAQVSSSQALHTPFWLGTFRERGSAFSRRTSRDLSLGITVRLSCNTVRRYAPLESWSLGLSSRIWLYIKYNWVLFGFFFNFKDIPVGRNHEKGQHPSRTIVEILEESSASPLWSCKKTLITLEACQSKGAFCHLVQMFRMTPETLPPKHRKLATPLTHWWHLCLSSPNSWGSPGQCHSHSQWEGGTVTGDPPSGWCCSEAF